MDGRGGSRRRLLGLTFVAMLALLSVSVVVAYSQVLTPYIKITVEAARSGLLLDKGADVTLRGVVVGKVLKVTRNGEQAVLDVGIYPESAPLIPASARSSIVAPTLFGPKYVALSTPPGDNTSAHIAAGAVITADAVGTEANDLLASLNTLLTSLDVGNLSSALGAASTTLRGRGDELGQLLVNLNAYVEHINPSIPALNADLATGADVAKIYAAATPDLVRTLSNLAVTSRTITDERDALPPLLSGVISASDATRDLLDRNGESLGTVMEVLRPTTSMLADYSPMFPCLFATANQERIHLEKVMGYQYPGLHMYDQLIPGVAPYQYSRDLPKIVPPIAPTCFGGPIKPADGPVPYVRIGDGTNSFVPSDDVIVRPSSPVPSPLPRVGPSQGETGSDARRAPEGPSTPSPSAPAVPGMLPKDLIGRPGEQNAQGPR